MLTSSLITESSKYLKQRNILFISNLISLFAVLALTAVIIISKKEIVLVPTIKKDSVISNKIMSKSYLEAITRDVITLMLDVSPQNFEYSKNSILKITHPAFYGELKDAIIKRNDDIKKRDISLSFYPQSITFDTKPNAVFVIGNLSTHLGKQEVSNEKKIYYVEYNMQGFMPQVMDFHEVKEDKKEGAK